MHHLMKVFVVTALLTGPLVGVGLAATTAAELVELAKAGLNDDILIALIQSDGSTFQLSAADILSLYRQGLSQRVILVMQATSRRASPTPPAAPIVEPAADPAQSVQQVIEPIPPPPAVVNVTQTVTQRVEQAPAYQSPLVSLIAVPVAVPAFRRNAVEARPVGPVYWGWGGQRRPDSWDDRASRDSRSSTNSDKRKGGN